LVDPLIRGSLIVGAHRGRERIDDAALGHHGRKSRAHVTHWLADVVKPDLRGIRARHGGDHREPVIAPQRASGDHAARAPATDQQLERALGDVVVCRIFRRCRWDPDRVEALRAAQFGSLLFVEPGRLGRQAAGATAPCNAAATLRASPFRRLTTKGLPIGRSLVASSAAARRQATHRSDQAEVQHRMRDLGPPPRLEVRQQLELPGVIRPVVHPAERQDAVGLVAAALRARRR
jgi:hypothetical protein